MQSFASSCSPTYPSQAPLAINTSVHSIKQAGSTRTCKRMEAMTLRCRGRGMWGSRAVRRAHSRGDRETWFSTACRQSQQPNLSITKYCTVHN